MPWSMSSFAASFHDDEQARHQAPLELLDGGDGELPDGSPPASRPLPPTAPAVRGNRGKEEFGESAPRIFSKRIET